MTTEDDPKNVVIDITQHLLARKTPKFPNIDPAYMDLFSEHGPLRGQTQKEVMDMIEAWLSEFHEW